MVRVVVLSDTHCLHREINEIPDGDWLIHCGDITNIGEIGVLADFNDWLGQLPHKIKICIAGNHDRCFQTKPTLSRGLLKNAIYLENSGVEIDGIKVWGSPLTSTLPSWSFVETDENKRREFWKQIPEDLDILITHDPPRGIMDQVPREYIGDGDYLVENCGDGMLLAEVTVKRPKYHVFGHIHENHGILESPFTTFINASICDPLYRPVNKPHVINL